MLASPTIERDTLCASFCEVAEQSFFAYAEAADPSPEGLAACSTWLTALVHFSGPEAGRLSLAVPESLGLELCSAFLGTGPEDALDPQAVDDLVGELANMAVGAWLTQVRREDCFALSHPKVTRVETAPATATVWMSCNGQPVAITFSEEPRPS